MVKKKGKDRILGNKNKKEAKMTKVEVGYISGTIEEKTKQEKRIIYKDEIAIINDSIVIDMSKISFLNKNENFLHLIIDGVKKEIRINKESNEYEEFINKYIELKTKKQEIL